MASNADGWLAIGLHEPAAMFAAFDIPLSWPELLKRTARETSNDDCLGLAAQLSYYFFLALFPAVLFVLALASFFPLANVSDDLVRTLRPVAPAEVLAFLDEQLRRISNADSGGILTLGVLGAVWSSSAAVVAIIGALNRAYDIEESRPWWKVRLTAIGLTIALALLVPLSFSLVLAGPALADRLTSSLGLGPAIEWTWKILQWPLVFGLVTSALGLVYYFAPDAEQDWVWITPGALVGTTLWFAVSLVFKLYAANFGEYNATYGAVGGVIVLLLWFYISGLAILFGAELNAEIEHASPHGKEPGEKILGQKKKIGAAAARAYAERQRRAPAVVPSPAPGNLAAAGEKGPIMPLTTDDRSLGQLFADLARDLRTLLQQEVQLAKTELGEKAARARNGVALIAGGGSLAYAGLLAVVAGGVLGLIALGMPAWAAALLMGAVAAGAGYGLIRAGLDALRPQALIPQQTIESVKEDAEWLKNETR